MGTGEGGVEEEGWVRPHQQRDCCCGRERRGGRERVKEEETSGRRKRPGCGLLPSLTCIEPLLVWLTVCLAAIWWSGRAA